MPLEANRGTLGRLPAGSAARLMVEVVQPAVPGVVAQEVRRPGSGSRRPDCCREVEGLK